MKSRIAKLQNEIEIIEARSQEKETENDDLKYNIDILNVEVFSLKNDNVKFKRVTATDQRNMISELEHA